MVACTLSSHLQQQQVQAAAQRGGSGARRHHPVQDTAAHTSSHRCRRSSRAMQQQPAGCPHLLPRHQRNRSMAILSSSSSSQVRCNHQAATSAHGPCRGLRRLSTNTSRPRWHSCQAQQQTASSQHMAEPHTPHNSMQPCSHCSPQLLRPTMPPQPVQQQQSGASSAMHQQAHGRQQPPPPTWLLAFRLRQGRLRLPAWRPGPPTRRHRPRTWQQ